jgi:hypothetical protein
VLLEIVLLVVFFALGLGLQRRRPSERLRERARTAYWWTVTPTLVFTAFTTIGFDRELGLALAAAVAASWLVIALGYAYARAVASERDERARSRSGPASRTRAFSATRSHSSRWGPTDSRSSSSTTGSAGSCLRAQSRP